MACSCPNKQMRVLLCRPSLPTTKLAVSSTPFSNFTVTESCACSKPTSLWPHLISTPCDSALFTSALCSTDRRIRMLLKPPGGGGGAECSRSSRLSSSTAEYVRNLFTEAYSKFSRSPGIFARTLTPYCETLRKTI